MRYQTKKWYIINDRNNGQYDEGNDKGIKIDTEVVKPFLCDYADAHILVTGDIIVEGGDANTKVSFKNCHPFTKSIIHLNDQLVEDSNNLDIIINMYNLIEYPDNYSDSTASLYQFKRQEQNYDANGNVENINFNDSSSFKYKSNLLGKLSNLVDNALPAGQNPTWKNAQIMVSLKYVSSFFRSLELPLINTKLYIQLNYTENSVISTIDAVNRTKFKMTKTELYVPVVTLSIEDNNKLNQLLLESESDDSTKNNKYKRSVYWNEYKSKIKDVTQPANNTNFKRTLLGTAISGVNRLFVAAFDNTEGNNRMLRNDHRKYFLPRINIRDYNILIDGRNFYDHNISDDF